MARHKKTAGFSLVEMLLVLAIIGIISAIAIPSFLGQRRRARVIGDARANSQVMRMQLETRKADFGIYGAAATYTWSASTGGDAAAKALLPAFTPVGNTKMNYTLVITDAGIAYTLEVKDPEMGDAVAFKTDQTGAALVVAH